MGWFTAHGLIKDSIVEAAKQAVKARFIKLAPSDALEQIASERSLERMPGESEDTWRTRLLAAWETWKWAGTEKGVIDAVKLTGLTNVAIFDYWDWPDGDAENWARFWVVIDKPHPWTPGLPWGSWTWGGGTWGSSATFDEVERVLRQVRTWKAAHAKCVAVMVIFGESVWGTMTWNVFVWGGNNAKWIP